MSIPAQECKAGLPLGLADQESRTGPEIQTLAAPEPAPAQPCPWLLRPPPHLNYIRLAASCPRLFRLVPRPRSQAGRRGSSSAFSLLPKTRIESGAWMASDVYRACSPDTGDHPPPANPLSETPLTYKEAEIWEAESFAQDRSARKGWGRERRDGGGLEPRHHHGCHFPPQHSGDKCQAPCWDPPLPILTLLQPRWPRAALAHAGPQAHSPGLPA